MCDRYQTKTCSGKRGTVGGNEWTVGELKVLLKELGEPLSGTKPVLCARLNEACQLRGVAPVHHQAPAQAVVVAAVTGKPLVRTAEGAPVVRVVKGRKSPSDSATSYAVGTEMVSNNDGQRYIVRLKKNGVQYWAPCSQKTANCTGLGIKVKRD